MLITIASYPASSTLTLLLLGRLAGGRKGDLKSSDRRDWSQQNSRGLKIIETNTSVLDRLSSKQSPCDMPDVWRYNRAIQRGKCYLRSASSTSLRSANHQMRGLLNWPWKLNIVQWQQKMFRRVSVTVGEALRRSGGSWPSQTGWWAKVC